MGVIKEYRRVPMAVALVGDRKAKVRATMQTEGCGPQRPPVEQPKPRCGRSAAMARRRSWVNIAVCPCLHSSLIHHRNIENKVWEIHIFNKEMCSVVHWSSSLTLIMFPLIFIIVLRYTTYFTGTNYSFFLWNNPQILKSMFSLHLVMNSYCSLTFFIVVFFLCTFRML